MATAEDAAGGSAPRRWLPHSGRSGDCLVVSGGPAIAGGYIWSPLY